MEEEKYIIPANPEYSEEIRKLQDSDPASASTVFNPLIERLIENITAVRRMLTADQIMMPDGVTTVSTSLSQKAEKEPLTWYDLPLQSVFPSDATIRNELKYARDQYGTVYISGGSIRSLNDDGSLNPTILSTTTTP